MREGTERERYRKVHDDSFTRLCVDCRTRDDLFRDPYGDGKWRCAACLCKQPMGDRR